MFYLIQRFDDYSTSKKRQRGEVISRHKEISAASKNRDSMNRCVVESEESLKVGELAIDLLVEYEKLLREERLIDLCCDVLKAQSQGEKPDHFMLISIADEGFSLNELLDKYKDEAQLRINAELLQRQKDAEKFARRSAINEQADALISNFSYSFPAVKGIQAGKEYYVAQIPYNILVKLFTFDDEQVPPELRAQRELSEVRAVRLSEYIISNPNDYVLPALTASVSACMSFNAVGDTGAAALIGNLQVPMDAMLLLNDGQHRRAGIEKALKECPALGHETIAITLYFDEGLIRSQQIFADINGFHTKPSSAINALYDHRNLFNVWIKDLLKSMPAISRRVEKETSSVGSKSINYWSLVSFKKCITALTGINDKNAEGMLSDERKELAADFVKDFFNRCSNIPVWSDMLSGALSPSDVRQSFVVGHAVFLEALGLACRGLLTFKNGLPLFANADLSVMEKLADIDPSKEAQMWAGRCIHMNVMQKNSTGVNLTANKLRYLMGIDLDDSMRSLEQRLVTV